MISANELIIGNYLLSVKTGKSVIVDWLVIKHIQDGNRQCPPYDMSLVYEPIKLTEELLLKCGFFYDCDSDTYKISDCTLQIDLSDFEIPEAIVFGESLRYIKYLHQMQNLYYALCGKELEIKF